MKNILYPSCQPLAQHCWYSFTGLGCRSDILTLPGRASLIQQEPKSMILSNSITLGRTLAYGYFNK